MTVSRYHPLLVVLHWLLALMIIGMLIAGFLVLDPMQNANPNKTRILLLHMSGGMLILALMLIRLVVRWRSARPTPATTGSPLLDRLAILAHYSFYLLVLLMVTSGFATAIIAGLNRSVFQRTGEPLPADFDVYPSFVAHSYLATILVLLIGLHVLAALYHQFVRKDHLLSRMAFGRRTS
jgi:cytochrome b561